MADKSRRQQILEVVLARVQQITTVNEFQTNAGKNAFLGFAPAVGPADVHCAVAIRIGDDEVEFQGEHVSYRLPIEFQALADADKLDQPWLTVEAVLADIKRAVELTQDPALEPNLPEALRLVYDAASGRKAKLLTGMLDRGSTITLEREPGSSTVGVQVTYFAPISEKWGTP